MFKIAEPADEAWIQPGDYVIQTVSVSPFCDPAYFVLKFVEPLSARVALPFLEPIAEKLEDRFSHIPQSGLCSPLFHRRNPERSLFLASGLGYPYSSDSLRSVGLVSDLFRNFPKLVASSGRIVFDVCGLPVLVPLLSTPHRCDAVTFRYGPEIVCPERTFTSL